MQVFSWKYCVFVLGHFAKVVRDGGICLSIEDKCRRRTGWRLAGRLYMHLFFYRKLPLVKMHKFL